MGLPDKNSDVWFENPLIINEGAYHIGGHSNVSSLLKDARLGAKDNSFHLGKLEPQQQTQLRPILQFMEMWPVFTPNPPHSLLHRVALPLFNREVGNRVRAAVETRIAELGAQRRPSTTVQATNFLTAMAEAGLEEFLGVRRGMMRGVAEEASQIISVAGLAEYDEGIVRSGRAALDRFKTRVAEIDDTKNSIEPLARGLGEVAEQRGCAYEDQLVGLYGQIVTGFLQPTCSGMGSVLIYRFRKNAYGIYDQDPQSFIEEVLRLQPPFHLAPRTALEDIEVEGCRIPLGARVVLRLDVANRDPRVFVCPDEVRLERRKGDSLSFARGAYACVGARMARHLISAIADSPVSKDEDWIQHLAWKQSAGTTMLVDSYGR